MALGQIFRGGFLIGVAVGVGVVMFGPSIWRNSRPLAKTALRTGIQGVAAARVAAARLGEEVEDLIAEVMHETDEHATERARSGDGSIRAEGAENDTANNS
jgi:hypothetical protein